MGVPSHGKIWLNLAAITVVALNMVALNLISVSICIRSHHWRLGNSNFKI